MRHIELLEEARKKGLRDYEAIQTKCEELGSQNDRLENYRKKLSAEVRRKSLLQRNKAVVSSSLLPMFTLGNTTLRLWIIF